MAMANLVSQSSSMVRPSQPIMPRRSRSERSFYSPPTCSHSVTSVSSPVVRQILSNRSPLVHGVEPISALVKESSGFVEKVNWSGLFGSNPLSIWDPETDDKFQCQWRKEGAVAETEGAVAKTEEDSTNKKCGDTITKRKKKVISRAIRRSLRTLRPKLYTVVVGASFCVVVGLCSVTLPKIRASRYVVVPYSDLVEGIRDGTVVRVQFVENSRRIYFNTKSLDESSTRGSGASEDVINGGRVKSLLSSTLQTAPPKWQFSSRNVEDDRYELVQMLKQQGVAYGSDPGLLTVSMKDFMFALLQLAPYWIMVLLTYYQVKVQLNMGKMTKRKPSKKQSVTFDDVEGVDAAKAELLEIVLCMKGDSNYMKLGAKLPRGVLLAGPPGTGKTLLARAVAGEAGMSFFSISASELVEVFVGRGAARVRDLFREARKSSPSIIFIDEIDAVGGRRGGTSNSERDQTLNQLLTDMDGFEKDASVVVIAATNRPETLDSALMRAGRFSRKVLVDQPDEEGRRKIFALYLKDVPMEEDKESVCNLVASRTPGLVGADLENIAHESVLLAARRGGEFVSMDDVNQAVERATTNIYDDGNQAKPFPFGSMAQERVDFGDGVMGFGFSD